MEITGKWIGHLKYGDDYGKNKDQLLHFEVELIQDGNKFSGTSNDVKGFGMSPDQAIINGTVNEDKIEFTKQYENKHYLDLKNKLVVDKQNKGHIIEYTGTYNKKDECYVGNWEINSVFKLLWLIPIKYKNTGTWEMKRWH
jgi:hypothetical protein